MASSSQQRHIHRLLLYHLHFSHYLLRDRTNLSNCLHCWGFIADLHHFLHNARPGDCFLPLGPGGTQSQWKKIQKEIFHFLEQLQHSDGPFLYDRTNNQDSGLYHQWQQQWNIQPQFCWENPLGNSFYICHHQNNQNRNCIQVLRTNHSEYQCHDEGRDDVFDNVLRYHARLLLWRLLYVQLSPGPGEEEQCGGLQYTRSLHIFLLGPPTGRWRFSEFWIALQNWEQFN